MFKIFSIKYSKIDFYILSSVLFLTSLGLLMVYSTSSVYALDNFNDSSYFLKRHLIYMAIGLSIMFFIMNINYSALKKVAFPIYLIGLALLIIVLIPGVGKEVGGAKRWIDIGMISFQPSEITKYLLVIYLSHLFSKNRSKVRNFSNSIVPYLLITGLYISLIMIQPDFGMVIILLALLVSMLFMSEVKIRYMLALGVTSLLFVGIGIFSADYRVKRVFSFLDPWQDPLGQGYQTVQSFVAFCLGGVTGTGLGEGAQKLYYLPQVHTDFIFSLIGEEMGFVGIIMVILAYAILIIRSFKTALNSPDFFGFYLVFGCILLIALQASINMAVSVGIFPTKGLTLPFISYGGSSLVSSLMAIGLILSVSQRVVKR